MKTPILSLLKQLISDLLHKSHLLIGLYGLGIWR